MRGLHLDRPLYRRKFIRTVWVALACGPVAVALWATDPRTNGWPVYALAAAILVVGAAQAAYYFRRWQDEAA